MASSNPSTATHPSTATAASEMLRSGQVSSREVTELALIRIDALNPSLYAVVELSREAAQQQLAEAEALRREHDL